MTEVWKQMTQMGVPVALLCTLLCIGVVAWSVHQLALAFKEAAPEVRKTVTFVRECRAEGPASRAEGQDPPK